MIPKAYVDLAIRRFDKPLFQAFTVAITVLSGHKVKKLSGFLSLKRLHQPGGHNTPQLAIVDLHRWIQAVYLFFQRAFVKIRIVSFAILISSILYSLQQAIKKEAMLL